MKAIVLTNAPVNDTQAELLKNTNIKKFAINAHAQVLNPDFRVCSDYGIIEYLLRFFPQKIVTTREWVPDKRLIYAGHIAFKGSTMVACIEYLIDQKYKDILIVGDNTIHDENFKQRINKEIDLIIANNEVNIFQYTNGNYNLPVKTVEQFIKGE